jgi:hypothetical protein
MSGTLSQGCPGFPLQSFHKRNKLITSFPNRVPNSHSSGFDSSNSNSYIPIRAAIQHQKPSHLQKPSCSDCGCIPLLGRLGMHPTADLRIVPANTECTILPVLHTLLSVPLRGSHFPMETDASFPFSRNQHFCVVHKPRYSLSNPI